MLLPLSFYLPLELSVSNQVAKMGSYVSAVRCRSDYGADVPCLSNFNTSNGTLFAGNYDKGNVPPNPDIAGIGVSILRHRSNYCSLICP